MRFLLFSTLFSLSLLADQVSLKNGDRISGKIVSADAKSLILKTNYAGDIKIDRTQITSITSETPLTVTLEDAAPVLATLEATPDSGQLRTATGQTRPAPLSAITSLRDDASQKAFVREEERLHRPRFNDFWSGFVSLGIANASGNSKTTTVSTSASATRAAGKNKLNLSFAQIYATQSTTEPFGATASRISGAFRIDRDFTPRLFTYATNSYDYDRFLDLDLRSVFGGGFGFHAWKSNRGFLDFSGGGNWNREKFSTSSGPFVRNSGEVAFSQEAAYQPLSRLKLWERFSIYPNLTQTGEYRFTFDSTAAVPVTKWLDWSIGFNNRYLSNPLSGKVKNDTILTMGIRVGFDQTRR